MSSQRAQHKELGDQFYHTCIIHYHVTFYLPMSGFVESNIFPIEEDAYDHEYDEVPSDEEPADKESTPEVRESFLL